MEKVESYLVDVFNWMEEIQSILANEQADEYMDVWKRLDAFSDQLEKVTTDITTEQLHQIQQQVDEMHREMEQYFYERKKIGTV